jgi:hypothetical protein
MSGRAARPTSPFPSVRRSLNSSRLLQAALLQLEGLPPRLGVPPFLLAALRLDRRVLTPFISVSPSPPVARDSSSFSALKLALGVPASKRSGEGLLILLGPSPLPAAYFYSKDSRLPFEALPVQQPPPSAPSLGGCSRSPEAC